MTASLRFQDDAILANGSNYALNVDQGQIELKSYGEEDYILVLPVKKIGPISDLLRCKIAIISTSPTQHLCPCELGISLEGRVTSDQPDIIHIDTVRHINPTTK